MVIARTWEQCAVITTAR